MRSSLAFLLSVVVFAVVGCAAGFQPATLITNHVGASRVTSSLLHAKPSEYIPSGFTKASWAEFKKKEAAQKKANLGRSGPRGFQSRSMQSFQEALERGEADHLMPMFNAKEKLKRGEIKKEDIPYMQRGGAWDNTDVKGAKKKKWLSSDKQYAAGGFLKSQSVSILGEGKGLDWTGKRDKTGPSGPVSGVKLGKNYKAPNVAQLKGGAEKPKKKKNIFGF